MSDLGLIIFSFGGAFVIAVLLTLVIKRLAKKLNVLDYPGHDRDRKIHIQPKPLLGGWAIYLAFTGVVLTLMLTNQLTSDSIAPKVVYGLLIAGLLIMIGGSLDDKFNFKPAKQLIWSILACGIVIISGLGMDFITNPLGGIIKLDTWKVTVFSMEGIGYQLTLLADLITFIWLMGMMYTTKLLDGLDGLVSGITMIGAIIIFGVTQMTDVNQMGTGLIALALAGSCAGFLIYNFTPAKIFLGQGGSLLVGFLLGSLAIVSGGKIATALLIMGIPILDVIWVITRRLFIEKRSAFSTDRKHLHFRLLDVGFSHRSAVLFLYLLTLIFGSTTLFFRGLEKLYALIVLAVVMVGLGVWLVMRYQKINQQNNTTNG
ncbi:MAG: MraY family glycosyltransferase [bacterium]